MRLLGLAPGEGCLATGIAADPGGLLHHLFTLTPIGAVIFCGPVRGSPRPGVTRHPAIWSADFPPPSEISHWGRSPGQLTVAKNLTLSVGWFVF